MSAGEWELVKSAGVTVYHRRQLSAERRVTAKRDRSAGRRWLWAVYDLTQGSRTGGLKVAEGSAPTWRAARARAEAAA